jgi:hypothetical protein
MQEKEPLSKQIGVNSFPLTTQQKQKDKRGTNAPPFPIVHRTHSCPPLEYDASEAER